MSAVAMPQMDGKERMLKYPQLGGPRAFSVPPVAGDFRVLRGNPGGWVAPTILSPRRHAPAECGARKLFIPFFRRRPVDLEGAASQLSWPDHRLSNVSKPGRRRLGCRLSKRTPAPTLFWPANRPKRLSKLILDSYLS